MYCTTSLTNDLLISSFSLRAKNFSQTKRSSQRRLICGIERPLVAKLTHSYRIPLNSAADTYSSVMFLSLDLASLIFSCRFLSIFFLRSFFSLWRETQGEWRSKKNKSSPRVCVRMLTRRMYVKTVLLLTDVSELFELGALAFLRYRGQLLNQLHGDRRGESHFFTISDVIPYFERYLPLTPTKYAEI